MEDVENEIDFGPDGTFYATLDDRFTIPLGWEPSIGDAVVLGDGEEAIVVGVVTAIGHAWHGPYGRAIRWRRGRHRVRQGNDLQAKGL